MASGGSFVGMLSDDVGIDDISFSMPYEQEIYAQQDALTFLYQLQKSSSVKIIQLHNTRG